MQVEISNLEKRIVWMRGAAVFSLLGFVWLFVMLGEDGERSKRENLIYLPYANTTAIHQQQAKRRVALPLAREDAGQGVVRYAVNLQTSAAEQIACAELLGIELYSSSDQLEIIRARLTIGGPGRTIAYSSSQSHRMPGGGYLELAKEDIAANVPTGDQMGKMEIWAKGVNDLSVFLQLAEDRPVSPLLWTNLQEPLDDCHTGSVWGWQQYDNKQLPKFSHAQLLAHMWGWGVGGSPAVYALCAAAGVFWLLGVMCMVYPMFAGAKIAAMLPALGCGLLTISIVIVFAVITPPFHGPDEADHFLTYATIAGKAGLADDALSLANAGHFERIKRRPEEKFTSINVERSRKDPWAHYIQIDLLNRSPLAAIVWKFASCLVSQIKVGTTLLVLRLISGSFVAACLTIALTIASYALRSKTIAPWLAAPFVMIPSVGYFSVMISNYPLLIGGYCMQFVACGMLWADFPTGKMQNRSSISAGILAGAGLGIAFCAAANAVAAMAFWIMILAGYFLATQINSGDTETPWKSIRCLCGSLLASFYSVCFVVALASPQNSFIPVEVITHVPLMKGNGIVAEILLSVAFGVTILASSFFGAKSGQYLKGKQWIMKCHLALIVLFVWLVAMAVSPRNTAVSNVNCSFSERPPLATYVHEVCGAFIAGFFPGQPDEHVVSYFWRSLGWHDCRLPYWIMDVLRLAVGFGLLLFLTLSLQKHSFPSRATFALGSVLALVTCLIVIAAMYYTFGINVNGRYIIVAFLFAFVLASEGYRGLISRIFVTQMGSAVVAAGLCVLAGALQSASWVAILNRYF